MPALFRRRLRQRLPADSSALPRVRLHLSDAPVVRAGSARRGRHRAPRRSVLRFRPSFRHLRVTERSGRGLVLLAAVLLGAALAAVVWTTGWSSLALPQTGRAFSPAASASGRPSLPRLDGDPCDLLVGPASEYCHMRAAGRPTPAVNRDAAEVRLVTAVLSVGALVAGVCALVVTRRHR